MRKYFGSPLSEFKIIILHLNESYFKDFKNQIKQAVSIH